MTAAREQQPSVSAVCSLKPHVFLTLAKIVRAINAAFMAFFAVIHLLKYLVAWGVLVDALKLPVLNYYCTWTTGFSPRSQEPFEELGPFCSQEQKSKFSSRVTDLAPDKFSFRTTLQSLRNGEDGACSTEHLGFRAFECDWFHWPHLKVCSWRVSVLWDHFSFIG